MPDVVVPLAELVEDLDGVLGELRTLHVEPDEASRPPSGHVQDGGRVLQAHLARDLLAHGGHLDRDVPLDPARDEPEQVASRHSAARSGRRHGRARLRRACRRWPGCPSTGAACPRATASREALPRPRSDFARNVRAFIPSSLDAGRRSLVGRGDHAGDAAADGERPLDGHAPRPGDADELVQDDVDDVLVEDALVAETLQVELEALELHAPTVRDVGDADRREIGLSRSWGRPR